MHAASRMHLGERFGASHRAVVRGKARTRRHWMREWCCLFCPATRTQLDNIRQPMMCDGVTQWRAPRND
jgi:hypothetical protein